MYDCFSSDLFRDSLGVHPCEDGVRYHRDKNESEEKSSQDEGEEENEGYYENVVVNQKSTLNSRVLFHFTVLSFHQSPIILD